MRTASADVKFVCCNADEGDSGTFADRMLIEGDPFTLVEGMTIAALAVGATEGYVYLRSEYPHAVRTLRRAIDIAYAHGVLGESVLGSGRRFDLDVRVGAGAYICGEETSMLESLEGKRGEVRAKPPIPALEGLFGRPTVVNNVLTLGAVPMVLADGGEAYAALGTGRSRGTQVFQLAGNVARGGIVEADFGVSLGDARRRLRWRHGIRAAGQGGAGGRAAGRLPAAVAVRPADGLRGVRGGRGDGRARRRGRVGRHDGRLGDGPLRDGVLREGVVRQVHAVPHRVDPRRRGHRPDPRGDRRRRAAHPARAARGPLHDDDQGLAVRDGRADPDAGAQRARALPRGLRGAETDAAARHPRSAT